MELMGELERLREENQKLKEDKEALMNIVEQMRDTLNRLLNRYIEKQPVY